MLDTNPDTEPDQPGTRWAELEVVRCEPGAPCDWYSATIRDAALERAAGNDQTARRLAGRARDHYSETVRAWLRAHRR